MKIEEGDEVEDLKDDVRTYTELFAEVEELRERASAKTDSAAITIGLVAFAALLAIMTGVVLLMHWYVDHELGGRHASLGVQLG